MQNQFSVLKDTMFMFHPNSALVHFEGSDKWQIVLANPLNEFKAGKWNRLELICFENHSIHKVNGKTNMMIRNAKFSQNNMIKKLESDSIQLQSEGAEVFFKNIQLRNITRLPDNIKQIS